ncbi:MAG: alanine racemase [Gemmatimonadota bacterium]|nr:alanine racemase [Gemmatimonadota bacterium]
MPQLLVNLEKLQHNIAALRQYCVSKGIELVGVLKCAHAVRMLVEAFQSGDLPAIAFSRVHTVRPFTDFLKHRPLLIGLPSPAESLDVVRHFSASFNSEVRTIRALAAATEQSGCEHGIYLMVDIGDLREGVMPEQAVETVREVLPLIEGRLTFLGLAANLGCASGTLPDENNLGLLQELAGDIEQQLGVPVTKLSVGGTIVYSWMQENSLPPRINQLRVGEGILCGYSPTDDVKLAGLYDDVFIFRGTVLEVREKVSPPPGRKGLDAHGHPPPTGPAGRRKRAILNFGLVDTRRTGLTPRLPGLRIVTSNSEYTVIDVTGCPETIRVGDELEFKTGYESMTQALFSPFVEIIPVGET